MVTIVNIKGFDEFASYTEHIDPNGPMTLFYFSGSKTNNGKSWCPDCEVDKFSKCVWNIMGKKTTILDLKNYEEFTQFLENLPSKKRNVYFFFTGSKKENGASWCIYCIMAEPIVKAFLGELKKNVTFVFVDVGDRDYWKEKTCPFRLDSRTRLMVIPTIIKWKGVQRLEGSQCNNRELLQMLFEDEDD